MPMLTGHLWDEHSFDRVGDFVRALTVESLEPNSAPLEAVARRQIWRRVRQYGSQRIRQYLSQIEDLVRLISPEPRS